MKTTPFNANELSLALTYQIWRLVLRVYVQHRSSETSRQNAGQSHGETRSYANTNAYQKYTISSKANYFSQNLETYSKRLSKRCLRYSILPRQSTKFEWGKLSTESEF